MCMLPLLQRIYLHGISRTGRRHLSFQPLSLLRNALSTLLSGCRKLGRPLDKNTVRLTLSRLAAGQRLSKNTCPRFAATLEESHFKPNLCRAFIYFLLQL